MPSVAEIDQRVAARLQPADVVFTSGDGLYGRFGRWVTQADYVHTSLVIGNGEVVEAADDCVRRKPLAAAVGAAIDVVVLRKRGLTAQQRSAIRQRALTFLGRPFDVIGSLGAGAATGTVGALIVLALHPWIAPAAYLNASEGQRDRRLFCSELVLRAFELSGVPLVARHSSTVMPQVLYSTANLDYVGHLRRPA